MARRQVVNKRILLTGATSGLGLALSEVFRTPSNKLFLTGRRAEKLSELANEIDHLGHECEWLAGDIVDDTFRARLVKQCVDVFGGIDCLINNAGVGAMGRFEDANVVRMRKVFDVNFFAMAELTRMALPHLKQGVQPIIVNVGSVLGHRATPLKSEYCASKFAVHGFSDALRAELVKDAIDVLHVCPSTIDTPFFEAAIEDATARNWKSGPKMTPAFVARKIRRAMERGQPELILPWSAKAMVWLDRIMPRLANFLVAKFGQ